MHGYGYGMGLWSGLGFGWLWMVLLLVGIVAAVAWVARRSPATDARPGSPEEALKQRLARGEISTSEYRELLDELRR
jgi:putative membrane protein